MAIKVEAEMPGRGSVIFSALDCKQAVSVGE